MHLKLWQLYLLAATWALIDYARFKMGFLEDPKATIAGTVAVVCFAVFCTPLAILNKISED